MPLGAVNPVAIFVLGALVGGQAEARDGGTAWRVLDLRIFAEIADENDFVDACNRCLSWPAANYLG